MSATKREKVDSVRCQAVASISGVLTLGGS